MRYPGDLHLYPPALCVPGPRLHLGDLLDKRAPDAIKASEVVTQRDYYKFGRIPRAAGQISGVLG